MMDLARLNRASVADATATLLTCCGSSRWATEMAACRPFSDLAEIHAAADRVWWELEPHDWLEALAAHPRIGERAQGDDRAARWAVGEQAGAAGEQAEVHAELARANAEYETRFGFLFVVCATGKTGREMLSLLNRRLDNDRDEELRVAAGEQAKITRLRLAKLLDRGSATL